MKFGVCCSLAEASEVVGAGFDYVELGGWHTHPKPGDQTPSNNPGESHGDIQFAEGLLNILNERAQERGERASAQYTSIIATPCDTRGWDAPTLTPWRLSQRKGPVAVVGERDGREVLSPGFVCERGRVL